jgi:hypothetical protein
MLKLALGRIVSAVFTAGGWLIAGARLVLDLIGYSTVPEDVTVAQGRVDQLLGYLLTLPWWAPLGFALVATLWLMHVSWPRQSAAASHGEHREHREVAPEKPRLGDLPPASPLLPPEPPPRPRPGSIEVAWVAYG